MKYLSKACFLIGLTIRKMSGLPVILKILFKEQIVTCFLLLEKCLLMKLTPQICLSCFLKFKIKDCLILYKKLKVLPMVYFLTLLAWELLRLIQLETYLMIFLKRNPSNIMLLSLTRRRLDCYLTCLTIT